MLSSTKFYSHILLPFVINFTIYAVSNVKNELSHFGDISVSAEANWLHLFLPSWSLLTMDPFA